MKKILLFCLTLLLSLNLFATGFTEEVYPQADKNGIISKTSYKIDNIFPNYNIGPEIFYPGGRGTNQLVIYKKDFGKYTLTNEYGTEAIVEGDTITRLSGANSQIPVNGYVISGHGNAKKWMMDNLKVGTKIKIDESSKTLTAYTTVESYKICAELKIKEVEKIVEEASLNKYNYQKVKDYLKKAQKLYRKIDGNDEESLKAAVDSIEMSYNALNYSLPYVENELKGIWVRPVEKNSFEVERTLNEMQKMGINSVFIETYYHGKTIFPSSVMKKYGFYEQNPEFCGFDVLAVWISEAHKRNIKVHTWLESFYIGNKPPLGDAKNILTVKPAWGNKDKLNYQSLTPVAHSLEHSGYFLDPANPEVTQFLEELIQEICAKYDIDGINLDYVRYPTSAKPTNVSYERTNWGYTDYARGEFKTKYLIDPIDIQYQTPMWDTWSQYRRDKVSKYVAEVWNLVKNRNVMLSAVIFPSEENGLETKQQDWQKWSQEDYVNAFTPLILTADYGLSADMIKNIKRRSNPKTEIYPGLFIAFMGGDSEDLLKQIHAARNEKAGGIVLFDWAHMDKKYMNTLKSSVFLPPSDEQPADEKQERKWKFKFRCK